MLTRAAFAAGAGAAGTLALVAALAGGYTLGASHARARTVTRTVTVTRTPPPKVITRWKTVPGPAVTKTADGVPCEVAANGVPYPPGSGTGSYQATCTVTWRESTPNALGTRMILTAPDGQVSDYALELQP
jgi:hypothetical protein